MVPGVDDIKRVVGSLVAAFAALAALGLPPAATAANVAQPLAPPPRAQAAAAPPSAAAALVVTAGSPRFWRLTRGGSTVWVLGEIEPMPKGLNWNSAPLARVIRSADRVLLPAKGDGSVWDALRALARSRLPNGGRLEADLPPQLEADYRAVLARLGRDPSAPRRDKPGWAALLLEIDFFRSRGIDFSEPSRTAARLARQDRVPVRTVAAYKAGAILRELVDLPEAEGRAALAEAVAGVGFGLDHVAAAGRAWAAGDLKAVRANVSPAETPLAVFLRTRTGKALAARAVEDTAEALRSALAAPGTTVAVLRLSDLDRRGGALDRLRAEGVAVDEAQP